MLRFSRSHAAIATCAAMLRASGPYVQASALKATAVYTDSTCSGAPVTMELIPPGNCSAQTCTAVEFNSATYYYAVECIDASERHTYVTEAYTSAAADYVMFDFFGRTDCNSTSYSQTHALLASGQCQPLSISGVTASYYLAVKTTLHTDGSAIVQYYEDETCASDAVVTSTPSKTTITSLTCYQASQFYIGTASNATMSEQATTSTSESSSNFGGAEIAGIVVASVALLLGVIAIVLYRRQRSSHARKVSRARTDDSVVVLELMDSATPDHSYHKRMPDKFLPQSSSVCSTFRGQTSSQTLALGISSTWTSLKCPTTSNQFTASTSTTSTLKSQVSSRAWEDDVVVAARIPRDKVLVERLLSRGGFGVVYAGMYGGQQVAVKMLLPETRRSIAHVTDFLAEVKMMASMEHERIVRFIGVAWDSLTNMCVVSEFMAGGDLKALLSDFEEQCYPTGFDCDKIKIALHMAHALTYMHSLDPPVIHRDLKSKNVLLSEALDAKLTDFGTSRERINESMTGGVGTCLWMAPEVMVGDRYDDKADMFSFGVVLSELDTHKSPYWYAKDSSDPERQMPEPVILQMVATGKLSVRFSENAIQSMVELGEACVSLDPKNRPTASQALFRLHRILSSEVET